MDRTGETATVDEHPVEQGFARIGSTETIRTDVHAVAATNWLLQELVDLGAVPRPICSSG